MKFNKKLSANMEKAYAVKCLDFRGENKFIIGTEKKGPLNLFDKDGNLEETIIEDFGGVMSIVPVPNEEESFLTTYKFYSPNDGYDAKIVHIKKISGEWKMNILAELPFVHRFDLLRRGGDYYIVACTIKSGFEFRNDWNNPGKVYLAKLPENLEEYSLENQLKLDIVAENLTKNHGFSKVKHENYDTALITSVEGVFELKPSEKDGEWEFEKILDQSTSDSLLFDIDGDGKNELVTISEFHGDHLDIYKEVEKNNFEKVYSYKKPLRFLHALLVEEVDGENILFVGQREGDRALFALKYDQSKDTYIREDIDEAIGVANLDGFFDNGVFKLVAANRESSTVCMYTLRS